VNPERILGCLDSHLTKMMRVDPQDRTDMEFLLENGAFTTCARLENLLIEAKVPPIPEIKEAFQANADWLRERVSSSSETP